MQRWLLAAAAFVCGVPPVPWLLYCLPKIPSTHTSTSSQLSGVDLDWPSSPQPAKIITYNISSKHAQQTTAGLGCVFVKLETLEDIS